LNLKRETQVFAPEFVVRGIGQSSPLIDASNMITVTI